MAKKMVEVTVRLELEEEEANELNRVLGEARDCEQVVGSLTSEEVARTLALEQVGRAALEEYVRMILGERVFTRGSDISEYRLFLLLKHAFANSIPPEVVVCRLFQLTPAGARTLVRNVLAKYQYELREEIRRSLRDVLSLGDKPQSVGNHQVVKIESDALVGLVKERIREWDLEEQIRAHDRPNEFLILPGVRAELLKRLR